MDFREALQAPNTEDRDRLIENQINEESWYDCIEDHMRHGGIPDDVLVEDIDIDDSDNEKIVVDVGIHFLESVASSCQDINHEHSGWANYRVSIDRQDASYEVECLEASVADIPGDDDESPYYPEEYY